MVMGFGCLFSVNVKDKLIFSNELRALLANTTVRGTEAFMEFGILRKITCNCSIPLFLSQTVVPYFF